MRSAKAAWMVPALCLAACAGDHGVRTVYVDRPVAADCVPADHAPAPPALRLTAAQLAAMKDAAARYQALSEFWLTGEPVLTRDEEDLAACRAAGAAPTNAAASRATP